MRRSAYLARRQDEGAPPPPSRATATIVFLRRSTDHERGADGHRSVSVESGARRRSGELRARRRRASPHMGPQRGAYTTARQRAGGLNRRAIHHRAPRIPPARAVPHKKNTRMRAGVNFVEKSIIRTKRL